MHCISSVQHGVISKADRLKLSLLQTAKWAAVLPACSGEHAGAVASCNMCHKLTLCDSCFWSQLVCCCRHFDVSTTGMLEEVKEGLALAFLEKMVSRDELWITATVSTYSVLYVWQLHSHPTASFCQCTDSTNIEQATLFLVLLLMSSDML